jgi:3-hydroxyisobutyrate dehydrogenase
MAISAMRSGFSVVAYDLDGKRVGKAVKAGAAPANSAAQAVAGADAVVTMVPAGEHSRQVYLADGVIAQARPGTILIDCSTVDIATAGALQAAAHAAGLEMVDAPVSGGALRAAEGKLTVTVGGTENAFERARPILQTMASSIHHMGPSGAGIAAKICNNLVLGVQLAALSEAFVLGERLGLHPEKLFRSMSQSSAQSWCLQELCPVPGPVATSPANNGYAARGAASLLLKDLGIAQQAAVDEKVPFPMGAAALSLYTMLGNAGMGHLDVCAVIKMYRNA